MTPLGRGRLLIVALATGVVALVGVGVGVGLGLVRCSSNDSSARDRERERSPVGVPIDVEISGCAAVLAGPTCELPADGALRLFVRAPADGVRFEIPGAPPPATKVLRAIQGGTLHRVVLPEGASALAIVAASGSPIRTVHLSARTTPRWLEEARALRQRGDVDAAATLARTHALAEAGAGGEAGSAAERAEEAKAVDRARALGLLARIDLAAGKPDAAFPSFREAIRLLRDAGRLSEAADDSFAFAFALNQRSHRYAEARAVLDETRPRLGDFADGWAREAYYRGTLATETGDPRAALRLLEEARARAERLGLGLLARNAINAHAHQLELVGRMDEALELLAKLEADTAAAPDASPCEKIEVAINRSFGALLLEERALRTPTRRPAAVDPLAALARGLADGDQRCTDRYLRVAALGNLSLAALLDADPRTARQRLSEARAEGAAARAVERLFWDDLEGRIALAEGDPARALAAFAREAERAGSVVSVEARWRAAVGRGEALERLHRNDEAVAAYRAAEEALTIASLAVPLGEGRGQYVGDHERSATAGVDLLVRLGRTEAALTLARSSRARVVTSLAASARVEGFSGGERAAWEDAVGAYRRARSTIDAEAAEDWRLSRTEAARVHEARERRESTLRAALDAALGLVAAAGRAGPPSPIGSERGVLTLAFHPARRGWIGFAAAEGHVTSFPIAEIPHPSDLGALAERVVLPVRSLIDRADHLRVLAYGPLRAVDFHALPYEGAVLASKVAVAYPLDLPEQTRARAEASALVVADPNLDLASARAEADEVERALHADRGWETIHRLEGSGATSAAVLPLLAEVALLHYAGHGVFAGREGWESALPLGAGTRLSIGDVLASARVPRTIVLSGCETARGAGEGPAESLGLAQSFVVAGADVVIAPVRPIADTLASRLARGLYRHHAGLATPGRLDVAAVLRDVELEVRRDEPGADWAAFRVVGR